MTRTTRCSIVVCVSLMMLCSTQPIFAAHKEPTIADPRIVDPVHNRFDVQIVSPLTIAIGVLDHIIGCIRAALPGSGQSVRTCAVPFVFASRWWMMNIRDKSL